MGKGVPYAEAVRCSICGKSETVAVRGRGPRLAVALEALEKKRLEHVCRRCEEKREREREGKHK